MGRSRSPAFSCSGGRGRSEGCVRHHPRIVNQGFPACRSHSMCGVKGSGIPRPLSMPCLSTLEHRSSIGPHNLKGGATAIPMFPKTRTCRTLQHSLKSHEEEAGQLGLTTFYSEDRAFNPPVHFQSTHKYDIYTQTYSSVYRNTYTLKHTNTYTNIRTHKYIHMRVYTYIYTKTHILTNTYTNVHTHTCKYRYTYM